MFVSVRVQERTQTRESTRGTNDHMSIYANKHIQIH